MKLGERISTQISISMTKAFQIQNRARFCIALEKVSWKIIMLYIQNSSFEKFQIKTFIKIVNLSFA